MKRCLLSGLVVVALLGGLAQIPAPASALVVSPDACAHAIAPAWFHRQLVNAIRISRDLPPTWAGSPNLAKIVCWQGTFYRTPFLARRGSHLWHGIFAMTVQEMQTMFGPWMTATRNAFHLSNTCFVRGWAACPHLPGNTSAVQQIIAGLRWIWLNYGTPLNAWSVIQRTGRFNSYPRQGTDDAVTHTPFRLCPVQGAVHYRDSLGEPRPVGGYHPHWGNDIVAPTGRAIRAPFDGFAAGHTDNWFAGHWVTVMGANGYVRNGHMSRFGHLGFVKAGTIIGYVGETGDARGPHDHFEWHPWVDPSPLHRSPFGFTQIMDAIDPFPFLNEVCGEGRVAQSAGAAGD